MKCAGVKLSDGKIADSTLIGQIFGGYLRNELKCCKCGYRSQTFNSFQDLNLEVEGGIRSVKDSLRAYTRSETLDNGNEWRCEKCKVKVQAKKQMMICSPPNVLTLQLKRFNYDGKINKHIAFDFTEELHHVDSTTEQQRPDGALRSTKYELRSIVVHHGYSTHSGHYVAFVKVL